MDSVIGISWPRSGHHMLVRLLSHYFGAGFGYCEFHAGHPNVAGLTECCKTVPCAHRDVVHLTKNHDFDLTTPQLDGQKYLIQYRDFVPSTVSNFELYVRSGQEDSELSFRKFASMEFTRYKAFVDKWVSSDFARQHLVMHYNALTQTPTEELAKVVRLIDPHTPVDSDRITAAVQQIDGERIERGTIKPLQGVGVHKARDISQFRYYKVGLFEDLANLNLTRPQVLKTFQAVLNRIPIEDNILHFQRFETIDLLKAHLMSSAEYRQKHPEEPPQAPIPSSNQKAR